MRAQAVNMKYIIYQRYDFSKKNVNSFFHVNRSGVSNVGIFQIQSATPASCSTQQRHHRALYRFKNNAILLIIHSFKCQLPGVFP